MIKSGTKKQMISLYPGNKAFPYYYPVMTPNMKCAKEYNLKKVS